MRVVVCEGGYIFWKGKCVMAMAGHFGELAGNMGGLRGLGTGNGSEAWRVILRVGMRMFCAAGCGIAHTLSSPSDVECHAF